MYAVTFDCVFTLCRVLDYFYGYRLRYARFSRCVLVWIRFRLRSRLRFFPQFPFWFAWFATRVDPLLHHVVQLFCSRLRLFTVGYVLFTRARLLDVRVLDYRLILPHRSARTPVCHCCVCVTRYLIPFALHGYLPVTPTRSVGFYAFVCVHVLPLPLVTLHPHVDFLLRYARLVALRITVLVIYRSLDYCVVFHVCVGSFTIPFLRSRLRAFYCCVWLRTFSTAFAFALHVLAHTGYLLHCCVRAHVIYIVWLVTFVLPSYVYRTLRYRWLVAFCVWTFYARCYVCVAFSRLPG